MLADMVKSKLLKNLFKSKTYPPSDCTSIDSNLKTTSSNFKSWNGHLGGSFLANGGLINTNGKKIMPENCESHNVMSDDSSFNISQQDNVFGKIEAHSLNSDNSFALPMTDSPSVQNFYVTPKALDEYSSQENLDSHEDNRIMELQKRLEEQTKIILNYQSGQERLEEQLNSLRCEKMSCQAESLRLRNELNDAVSIIRDQKNVGIRQSPSAHVSEDCSSALIDSQKEQLLFEKDSLEASKKNTKSISAPPSISGCPVPAAEDAEPEWDSKSSIGGSSSISVACLQDRIYQMEESNYSTHEELQATLQELFDLQNQVDELVSVNRILTDEKSVLYESLCQQTEKLEACRCQRDNLRSLLLEKNDTLSSTDSERRRKGDDDNEDDDENEARESRSVSERENKLIEVIRAGEEERFRLTLQLDEATSKINALESEKQETSLLQERILYLEKIVDTNKRSLCEMEKTLLDSKICHEQEIGRIQASLDAALIQLEQREKQEANSVEGGNQLKEVLASVRREKDVAVEAADELKLKLKSSLSEYAATKARSELLEEKTETLCQEVSVLRANLSATSNKYESTIQQHLNDKRDLKAGLNEAGKRLQEAEKRISDCEAERKQEQRDWAQFQSDLLITVRVANDFKTDAQAHLERVIIELVDWKNRCSVLDRENSCLRQQAPVLSSPSSSPTTRLDMKNRALKAASVKGLIESIESAAKMKQAAASDAASNYGRSISNPTLPVRYDHQIDDGTTLRKPPTSTAVRKTSVDALISPSSPANTTRLTPESADPLINLVRNGGSRRNALLKWCQMRTVGYKGVDITNFSSSWNDGLALCAILHTYLPHMIDFASIDAEEKRRNFTMAFEAAESVGITTTLNLTEMISFERPDWQKIMSYVTQIYMHFET